MFGYKRVKILLIRGINFTSMVLRASKSLNIVYFDLVSGSQLLYTSLVFHFYQTKVLLSSLNLVRYPFTMSHVVGKFRKILKFKPCTKAGWICLLSNCVFTSFLRISKKFFFFFFNFCMAFFFVLVSIRFKPLKHQSAHIPKNLCKCQSRAVITLGVQFIANRTIYTSL